jgi:hypothetical protein
MVEFMEPLGPDWVTIDAAAAIRGVNRETVYDWVRTQGAISYREIPKLSVSDGKPTSKAKDRSRLLVKLDEVQSLDAPARGHQAKLYGRKRRPLNDPLTQDEETRLAAIKKAYKQNFPQVEFELEQSSAGYYFVRIWEDTSRARMIVTLPLQPGHSKDGLPLPFDVVDAVPNDWIGLKEAAALREVSISTIFRWATHAGLISFCRLPVADVDVQMVPILVRRSEIERLVPPPRGNPSKTGSRGNRPEGDPLTSNERSRMKEIEETYRKAKPDCVIDLRQYASGYYVAEIFENATRKKMVVTLPLAPGEMLEQTTAS